MVEESKKVTSPQQSQPYLLTTKEIAASNLLRWADSSVLGAVQPRVLLFRGCSTHGVLVGGVKLECSESQQLQDTTWGQLHGPLGLHLQGQGSGPIWLPRTVAACGGSVKRDTAIVTRKGMARERTPGGEGSRRDGQMPVPRPQSAPFLFRDAQ